MRPEVRARIARGAAWILAVATTWTGATFVLNPTFIASEDDPNDPTVGYLYPVDVGGVGLALLCVGILVLSALLISEAYFWRAHDGYDTAPADGPGVGADAEGS